MQGVGRVARSNFMHALCLRSYKLLFVFAVLGSFPVNIIDFCHEETLHRSSVVCWVKHPSPRWELYKERSKARGARHQPLQVAPTGQMGVLHTIHGEGWDRDHAFHCILKNAPPGLQLARRFTELLQGENPAASSSDFSTWRNRNAVGSYLTTATNMHMFILQLN